MHKIPENIAIDGLERETPFKALCETLKLVADKYNPECRPPAYIRISDSGISEREPGLPGEPFPILPSIDIHYSAVERPVFEVTLNLDGYVTVENGSAVDCWRRSRYSSLFTDDSRYRIILDNDLDGVARFVTYYMRLFGYAEEKDFEIDYHVVLQEGDNAKLRLSDDIIVPDTLRRAIARIRELGIDDTDGLILRLIPSDSRSSEVGFFTGFSGDELWFEYQQTITEEEYKKAMTWHNAGIISASHDREGYFICFGLTTKDQEEAMRLMTDFYRHQTGDHQPEPVFGMT